MRDIILCYIIISIIIIIIIIIIMVMSMLMIIIITGVPHARRPRRHHEAPLQGGLVRYAILYYNMI